MNLFNIIEQAAEGTDYGWIMQLLWIGMMFVLMFYGQKIQLFQISASLEAQLMKFKALRNHTRKKAIEHIKEVGKGKDIEKRVDELFLNYITISPNNMDPSEIVEKVEHILNTRDYHWEEEVKLIAPKASAVERKNIENILECAFAVDFLYRYARHWFLMGKKSGISIFLVQAQMIMGILFGEAKSYCGALSGFFKGCPIGDGIGPMIVTEILNGKKTKEIAKETMMGETKIRGRTVYLIKAKGTGGSCGNVDEAIKTVLQKEPKVSLVIMIDAGLMGEGDKRGGVIEGVGAAIGGSGTERFRIEEITTKYKIPCHCFVVKETLKDAISPMKKEIADASSEVIARIKRLLSRMTQKGDKIIIVGVGNTIGIGE